MSIIVSNCQHCDEQQFQTLSCVHYSIFSVVKLDLFIRALLLDRILALGKTTRTPHVHLVLITVPLSCSYPNVLLSNYSNKVHRFLHLANGWRRQLSNQLQLAVVALYRCRTHYRLAQFTVMIAKSIIKY